MFKKGDVVRFEGSNDYAAKEGALAQVTSDEGDNEIVELKWLDVTSHLNNKQTNGGYISRNFSLVTSGERTIESILEEIDDKLTYIDVEDLKDRYMNLLGEMSIDRLENILEDLNNQ
jgi:hypothetical protein